MTSHVQKYPKEDNKHECCCVCDDELLEGDAVYCVNNEDLYCPDCYVPEPPMELHANRQGKMFMSRVLG